jgi:large subunit ribosomal protein L31
LKSNTHPTYYHDAVVTCACGNTFTTGSTKQKIAVDVCSACHPFFTGQMKFVDTQGRVERFQAKMKAVKYVKKQKTPVKKEEPKSLKDMLKAARKNVTT